MSKTGNLTERIEGLEDTELAKDFVRSAVVREGVDASGLTIHPYNGLCMASLGVGQQIVILELERVTQEPTPPKAILFMKLSSRLLSFVGTIRRDLTPMSTRDHSSKSFFRGTNTNSATVGLG